MSRNFHSEAGMGLLDRPSADDVAEFVEAITGEPVSRGRAASEGSSRPERHQLQWLAEISTKYEIQFWNLLREETLLCEAEDRKREHGEWPAPALEDWDESKHPRLGGPPNAGWFASTGDSNSAVSSGSEKQPTTDKVVRKLPTGPQILAQVAPAAQAGGAAMPAWPTVALPKVGGAAAVGAAGTAAGAARNASMVNYWTLVPGVQGMQQRWAYELEKRVRAGTLSREDAIGIFGTAVLGAEAQTFKPAGNTHAAVRDSMMDFLGKAEAVYFARKKAKEPDAAKAGAYQQSGRRVFPTEKNSGLKGEALRKEQEDFFERGLSEGKTADELRGQAHVAGVGRSGRMSQPDRLDDHEIEAALQRAIQKSKK